MAIIAILYVHGAGWEARSKWIEAVDDRWLKATDNWAKAEVQSGLAKRVVVWNLGECEPMMDYKQEDGGSNGQAE